MTPEIARRPSTIRLRRFAYSASIAGTLSIVPVMAASAAYCAMDVGFDVDWLCSLISAWIDRKSTRLNSSHGYISYAVFCLKKKKRTIKYPTEDYSPLPYYPYKTQPCRGDRVNYA